ncbi:MAG: glycosyltransferase [Candidatus Paracaedibacteraceae bacterium]|nr:glycosyltransferase [Candidatus Paracaedibacteraceae bacterium]
MNNPKILNIMLSRGRGGIEQAFINIATMIDKHTDYDQMAILDKKSSLSLPDTIKQARIRQSADWDPFGLYALKKIISSYKPNVILCHGNRPLKMMLTLRRFGLVSGRIIGFCHNYSIKHLIKADAILAVSQHMIDDHLIPAGFQKNKVFHLPNMIDLVDIKPIKLKPKTDTLIIGAMGRFVKKKGFEDFIQAIGLVKNKIKLKVIIGGSGPEEASLKALTQKLSLDDSIEFVGWVHDKRAFYDKLNVFCIPSCEEPFGIIALDTLAYGCPLISTCAKGLAEILEGQKSAVLCEVNNPESLAQAIHQISDCSDDQIRKMQLNGLNLAQRYSMTTILNRFKEVFPEINCQ